jgi:uncharacterized membrane protein
MSLAPLLNAEPVIQVHAFAAMAAFGLGIVQLTAPKGTLPHRTIGWIWVILMALIALSSFFIHEIKLIGPFSPIHLLSIFTLVMLPLAVAHARHHQVQKHRKAMTSIFIGAGYRGSLHVLARPHHACGRVGLLSELALLALPHLITIAGKRPLLSNIYDKQ